MKDMSIRLKGFCLAFVFVACSQTVARRVLDVTFTTAQIACVLRERLSSPKVVADLCGLSVELEPAIRAIVGAANEGARDAGVP